MTSASRGLVTVVAAVPLVLGIACTGVDSYDDFRGAVDAGAPCEELFDQRTNFDDEATLEKIDRDLDEIGCDSPQANRTDE